jgi:carbonic anhydrase/acetyltransferase-like protein (isoleucine patch superfamily)
MLIQKLDPSFRWDGIVFVIMKKILPFQNILPVVADDVFVAQGACVMGDVHIGAGSSIWFNTVLRGDVNFIRVGKMTNIQDLSVVHVESGKYPTIIGDDVTIGHKALIHGCTIGDGCLIGMGAILMDGVDIGAGSIVAAGSLVTEGMRVPPHSVVKGFPARVCREVRAEEKEWLKRSAKNYYELAKKYLERCPT